MGNCHAALDMAVQPRLRPRLLMGVFAHTNAAHRPGDAAYAR